MAMATAIATAIATALTMVKASVKPTAMPILTVTVKAKACVVPARLSLARGLNNQTIEKKSPNNAYSKINKTQKTILDKKKESNQNKQRGQSPKWRKQKKMATTTAKIKKSQSRRIRRTHRQAEMSVAGRYWQSLSKAHDQ